MEEIKRTISQSFYTQPLMIASALLAFIYALVHRKKFEELQLVFSYPLASLIQMFMYYYVIRPQSDKQLHHLESTSRSAFIVLEFLIFSNFFYKVMATRNLKRSIQLIFVAFCLYIIYVLTFTNSFYHSPNKIYLPEALCILSFCFLYFYQLFKLPPKPYLLNHPSFWFTTGCLFYFSCTIPLFFVESIFSEIPDIDNLYAINYLAYTTLFLFIIKAFSCSPIHMK